MFGKGGAFDRNSVKVRNDWKVYDTLPLLRIKLFRRAIASHTYE